MNSFQASADENSLCQTQRKWGTPGKTISMTLVNATTLSVTRQAAGFPDGNVIFLTWLSVPICSHQTFLLGPRPWQRTRTGSVGSYQESEEMAYLPVRVTCAVNHSKWFGYWLDVISFQLLNKNRIFFINQIFRCNLTDIEMAYTACLG